MSNTFAKIPPDCQLTERSTGIPAWDTISAEMKPVLVREMEIYAGFLEHVDHHVGRLLDALKDLEILDDTLIYLNWVEIDLGKDSVNLDHLISHEQRLHLAMGIQ
jgi:Sulfatase